MTEFGIVIDVKEEHPENVNPSIDLTEFGIVIDVKDEHP